MFDDAPAGTPSVLLRRGAVRPMAACLVLVLTACDPPAPSALPEGFLGRWYYLGSTGGITGDGLGDKPEGYIVIGADSTMAVHRDDGTAVSRVAFTVSRGKTIFADDEQWMIHVAGGEPEVIIASEDGRTMTLCQDAYGGIGRRYARSR